MRILRMNETLRENPSSLDWESSPRNRSFRLRRKDARANGPSVMFGAEARVFRSLQLVGLRATRAQRPRRK